MGLTTVPAPGAGLPSMAVRLASQSFSAVSSVSAAASTFTTSYHKYLIFITIDSEASSPGQLYGRLRSAGTDLTTLYNGGSQFLYSSGAPSYGNQVSGGNAWNLNANATNGVVVALTLINPAHTGVRKQGYGQFSDTQNIIGGDMLVANTNTGAYDAFTFFISSGTMTGRYEVYGYTE
jgi:hypothetical protein